MNPLNDNFVEENREFVDRFFSGKMKTTLVICHECENIYLTEHGPSIEFASSYCPFCKKEKTPKIVPSDQDKDPEEYVEEIKEKLEGSNGLAKKVKNVFDESIKKQYNVAACNICNNRFIFMQDDIDEIGNCCYCGTDSDDMISLVEYMHGTQPGDVAPGEYGIEKYIGRLFFIRLTNGVEDNFILTDVDATLKTFRFVSVKDKRMAMWIKEAQVIDMYEFIQAPNNEPPPDEEVE
jgi:hypothetical protein